MVFSRAARKWHDARIASVSLGKYIVVSASFVHYLWAALLIAAPHAVGATPLSIISEICGGRFRAAFALCVVASSAVLYPFVSQVGRHAFCVMLVPQQTFLLLSAGAGIKASFLQHYADGVERGWPFILADQSPMIVFALLYTIAVIEAAWSDERVVSL